MSAQQLAARWHWGDVLVTGACFAFALVGLVGHYRLRRQYAAELERP